MFRDIFKTRIQLVPIVFPLLVLRKKSKTLILRLGMPRGLHSTPDPPGLEAPRTQTSTRPTVLCPYSHPQDLRLGATTAGNWRTHQLVNC